MEGKQLEALVYTSDFKTDGVVGQTLVVILDMLKASSAALVLSLTQASIRKTFLSQLFKIVPNIGNPDKLTANQHGSLGIFNNPGVPSVVMEDSNVDLPRTGIIFKTTKLVDIGKLHEANHIPDAASKFGLDDELLEYFDTVQDWSLPPTDSSKLCAVVIVNALPGSRGLGVRPSRGYVTPELRLANECAMAEMRRAWMSYWSWSLAEGKKVKWGRQEEVDRNGCLFMKFHV